ncbi:glycosyltransferase family 4 protein [Soonwooa sp.]|uniref:MraY family glycosyltransferase n=1 Tax=Soonwooa sp. TaxID=1938592 RepID=UPI00262DA651|nr:glycosyltransferase family 4 protein [Soonwooa sp.]
MDYFVVFVSLILLELLYFKIADKYNIIDKPNERSSHTQITLRGGGIIFYLAAAIYFVVSGFEYPYFFLGLTLITLVSFIDDVMMLSNKIRLLVQLISMLLMFYQVGMFSLAWWLIPIALVVSVGTINAYNFMDGINGITVSNSLAVLILLAIVNNSLNFVDQNLIYYTILSCLVFGFFNFRNKAKCFAGDVGSVAMAFIILFLLANLIVQTGNIIYILFLLIYGLDTILTIIRRLLRKENIFEAHRSHLYQFFANENETNRLMISAIYGILQLLVGLLVIYSTTMSVSFQVIIATTLMFSGTLLYLALKQNLIKKHKIA